MPRRRSLDRQAAPAPLRERGRRPQRRQGLRADLERSLGGQGHPLRDLGGRPGRAHAPRRRWRPASSAPRTSTILRVPARRALLLRHRAHGELRSGSARRLPVRLPGGHLRRHRRRRPDRSGQPEVRHAAQPSRAGGHRRPRHPRCAVRPRGPRPHRRRRRYGDLRRDESPGAGAAGQHRRLGQERLRDGLRRGRLDPQRPDPPQLAPPAELLGAGPAPGRPTGTPT